MEVRWLQKLAATAEIQEVSSLSKEANDYLNKIVEEFSLQDAERIKRKLSAPRIMMSKRLNIS